MKKDDSNELGIRFRGRYNELKQLYHELYPDDQEGFRFLCALIKQFYTERSKELKALDRKREKRPFWSDGSDIVGMSLYVDSFSDGLSGVLDTVDYCTACGVNYLHIRTADDSDRSMNAKALKGFAALCHKRGICCGTDFTLNHTADHYPWAEAARAGDRRAQGFYYYFDGWDVPDQYARTLLPVASSNGGDCFTQLENGQVVLTAFGAHKWDLNYANPMVFSYMTAELLKLANAGFDVIYLDKAPYIWKKLGTTCRNLPQAHSIVRMLHIVCEVVCPSVALSAETMTELSKTTPFFGTVDKPECRLLTNASSVPYLWNAFASRDVRLLTDRSNMLSKLPKHFLFFNELRLHDGIIWDLDYAWLKEHGMEKASHLRFLSDYFCGRFTGSTARGEWYPDERSSNGAKVFGTVAALCGIEAALWDQDEAALSLAVDAAIMLHAFVFTQSGIPVIQMGDEIGRLNDYLYRADIKKKFDPRYLQIGRFSPEEAEKRSDPEIWQAKLFSSLHKLGQIRAKNAVFSIQAEYAAFGTGSRNVFGVTREYRGQKLTALFNFCEEERKIALEEDWAYTDLMTGEQHKSSRIVLKPYGFIWASGKSRSI